MAEGKRRRGRGRVGLGVYKRAGEAGQEEGWFWDAWEEARGGESSRGRKGQPRSSSSGGSYGRCRPGLVLVTASQSHRVTDLVALPGRGGSSASKHSAMSELCWGDGELGKLGSPAWSGQNRHRWGRAPFICHHPAPISPLSRTGGRGRGAGTIGNLKSTWPKWLAGT